MSRSTAINRAPIAANAVAQVNTVQLFLNSNNAALPAILPVGASGLVEQNEFEIAGGGYVTTVGAYTVTIGLYAKVVVPAAPTVAANWTLIGASTARAVGTTSCPWKYRAYLIADAVSGKLQGEFECSINNLFDARAAVTNVVAAVNLASIVEPGLNFAFGVTFNTAALNIAKLNYFNLEI